MFKEFKMADVSTAHIYEADKDLLEDADKFAAFPFSVSQYEEGFFINLASIRMESLPTDCAQFSPQFQRVLRLAKEAGFDFINFDRDGEVYDELKKFDW